MLAEGTLPSSLVPQAFAEIPHVDPALVARVVAELPRAPLRDGDIVSSAQESYREAPAAWEAALDALPDAVTDLVAGPRCTAGAAVPQETKARVLEHLARAIADGDHHYVSDIGSHAQELGDPRPALVQRVAVAMATIGDAARVDSRTYLAREALGLMPWPFVRGHVVAGKLRDSLLVELLTRRSDAVADLGALVTEGVLPLDWQLALLLARRGALQQVVPPKACDPLLAEAFIVGLTTHPRMTEAVDSLPPERREAIVQLIRAAPSPSFGSAGLLQDPRFDEEILDVLLTTIATGAGADDYRNALVKLARHAERVASAGEHGRALLTRALAETGETRACIGGRLAFSEYPARVRFLLRRSIFASTAGLTERPLELLMPGEDQRWAADLVCVFGALYGTADQGVLAEVDPASRQRLFDAWAAIDWDGTLELKAAFGIPHTPPSIEERPFAELASAFKRTSFMRLWTGERQRQTVSRALRRPEPLPERLALAEAILVDVIPASRPALLGAAAIFQALLPELMTAGQPLGGAWERAAYALLERGAPDDLLAQLARLPRPQVEDWVARLVASRDPRTKKQGKQLRQLAG